MDDVELTKRHLGYELFVIRFKINHRIKSSDNQTTEIMVESRKIKEAMKLPNNHTGDGGRHQRSQTAS